MFSKILGNQQLQPPIVYWNIKKSYYKIINDVVAYSNRLLLNTDKGLYTVNFPVDSELTSETNIEAIKYNTILYYQDTVIKLNKYDTLEINPKTLKIQFDIINPLGNGKPKYSYKLGSDSLWHELNSNEITLPQNLIPGKYYLLSVRIYDDAWRSETKSIFLFIKPKWWQLLLQSKLFWVGVSAIILGIIALIIFITKKIVTKNNLKRNMRVELELKSVYSQINPHFIFNTLGTLMYFIKKEKTEQAYAHVSKFSKLLRAYIKSSRNKYITIASELENLNNYIQLQQARFEDRFDYIISVDENIDTESITIPSLLLQPIVENAIDHGLFHKETKGHLTITFNKIILTNEIQCIIDDDGIGRKQSKLISKGSLVKTESYGEQLISDLVTIFNKYERISISIRYIDKIEPHTGTTVIISIKYPANDK